MSGDGLTQLAEIIPRLRAVGAGIGQEQLGNSTPCAAFSVAGVLGHMTALGSAFAPLFRGEEPTQGDPSGSGDLAAFDQAMVGLLAAVRSEGALERTLQTPAGEMSGAVFARLVAFDGAVHGWDLATSTGQPWELPDAVVAEIADFARQALTSDLRDGDVWADEQQAPVGATAVERLAAFSGRTVG